MSVAGKLILFGAVCIILAVTIIRVSETNAGSGNVQAANYAPYGATNLQLVGNGWFTYCFEGTKMLQYYRDSYKEGYVAVSNAGECD